jgi:DNA helicase HerA-like ATPase
MEQKTLDKNKLGRVISGSLSEGLLVRINYDVDLEAIKTGKFVSAIGNTYRFFSLITDLKLEVANPDAMLFLSDGAETVLHEMVRQREMYAIAKIKPMIMLDSKDHLVPVKTIPPHFSQVANVDEQEVALIFGKEDGESSHFCIGYPLDMTTPVCINLEHFGERSSGVFGKTGTGKTFITRLLLAGVMRYSNTVSLIFDMHSEYGLQARQEGKNKSFVKGLKTLFPEKTAIFSLDPASTRRRGGMPDVTVTIPYTAIGVADILSLQSELNLHPTALEAAYLVFAKYKEYWLEKLLEPGMDLKEFAEGVGAHPESISALYRKLKRVERLPFFVPGTSANKFSVIDQMMEYVERGISIIIEFGNYTSTFVYLLIANIITRRIHAQYIAKTEKFLGSQDAGDEPNKLLIVIEEAHKFLNTNAAQQTIFGTIAREMRKYYVSLLIVDQRPSGIDAEVLSQIGTKIIAQLNDEKDIQAVLMGSSGSSGLRTVLASLDSKQQALVLGHAIPMPVVIQTRKYDEAFYASLGTNFDEKKANSAIEEMF